MKAVLSLEIIGDNHTQRARAVKRGDAKAPLYVPKMVQMVKHSQKKYTPWVARITGLCNKYGLKREFMRGQKDYSLANSVGSRGVYVYYPLDPGIYEVNERLTWKRVRRYFIQVQNAEITEITREQVLCLINATSE